MRLRKLLIVSFLLAFSATFLVFGMVSVQAISLENSLEGTGTETITNIGNLSIGTDTISGALYVVGDITATGDIVAENIGGTTTITAGNVSAGSFGANTGGGNYSFPANVTLSGILNINSGTGNVLTLNNGGISGVNQLVINDPGEGLNLSSGITIYVVDDANDDSLYINAPYVGIGTETPATKLDVSVGGTTVGISTAGYIEDVGGNVSTNYTPSHSWVAGGTGSAGIFGQNGGTSENSRVWGIGPHGNRTILWKSVGDTSSGPDGGWNSSYFSIDDEKTYRFTVWIKKSVTSNGSTYFGTHGQGCDVTSLGGTPNSNPYFWSGGLPSLDKWYLLVGYVHASNDTSTTSYGGIYDGVTGQRVLSAADFKFQSCTTGTHHRSYLYYSTTGTATQYWWDPRVEEVNGSEPTIEALLGQSKGATAGNASYFGAGVSVNGTVTADSFSGSLSGTVSASNVSSGSFGSGTGGGNYTFPSNLTVDTNTLYVDSSNDWVGIGTTSPGAKLGITNSDFLDGTIIINSPDRHDTGTDDIVITGGISEGYPGSYTVKIGDLQGYSGGSRVAGVTAVTAVNNTNPYVLNLDHKYIYGITGTATADTALNLYGGSYSDYMYGVYGVLSGELNEGSTSGYLAAAVRGNDASTGTATTWAGYFDGNVNVTGTLTAGTIDADTLDGLDSGMFVYGEYANNGSSDAPTTWSYTDPSQYRAGFWDVNGASWAPDTGWWWGVTLPHRSNYSGYNYGGQIVIRNSSVPTTYVRSITNGTANSWAQVWTSATDGSGSGLVADTLDGVNSSQFLRSDAADTASGALTLSGDTTDLVNISANSTNDNRGISFNSRTALSADYNDGWLRLNNASEFTNGVYSPGKIRAEGGLYVSDDEYFWSDSEDRIATTDDFYVQASSNNTYLYSTNTYLGNSSGDNIRVRDNQMFGDDWIINDGGAGSWGIGITDPEALFEVKGQLFVRDGNYVEIKPGGATYGLIIRDYDSSNWGGLDANDGYLAIGYNNSDGPLFINDSDQVGIGTTSLGNYNLYVSGTSDHAFGASINGTGSASYYGIYGSAYSSTAESEGRSYGIYGVAGNRTSNYNYGIYGGINGSNNGAGIVGRDWNVSWSGNTNGRWAGYFVGNVYVAGTLSKSSGSFLIDHPLDPLNKNLRHSFVESPEMVLLYKGRANLEGGEAVIELPDYFDALNRDDDIEYALTPINSLCKLAIKDEVKGNEFTVMGDGDCEFSWVVYSVRDDAYARANPIVVEEEKESKGSCLNEEACEGLR